jgi:hypothetical protein
MMFDAPGSEKNPITRWLAYSIWSFIPLAVVSIAAAQIAGRLGYPRFAQVCSFLPVMSFVSGIAAMVTLQVVHGGRFAGK